MDSHSSSFQGTLIELNEQLKPIVWLIKATGVCEGEVVQSYFSGFSITSDGHVMTCAHCLSNMIPLIINARPLDHDDFTYDATIVTLRPNWDIALLKVEGVTSCDVGVLASDGSLYEGETLYHLGNPHEFVGSFLIGHAAYKCVESVDLPSRRSTCAAYVSTSLIKTPPYRLLGHIWNKDVFTSNPSRHYDFEKKLHPLVPIIQVNGLTCGEGCSGGPVFNTRGEIVGMLVLGIDGYQCAIHVTMLREFIRLDFKEKEQLLTKYDPKGKGHVGDQRSEGVSKKMRK